MGGKTAIAIGLLAGLVAGGAAVAGALVLTPAPSASGVATPSVSPAPSAVEPPSATAPVPASSAPSTSPSTSASPSSPTGGEAFETGQGGRGDAPGLPVDDRANVDGVVGAGALGGIIADVIARGVTSTLGGVALTP